MSPNNIFNSVISKNLCVGCGVCTYKCEGLSMNWNNQGFLVPEKQKNFRANDTCIKVCPFNPKPDDEVKTENELAKIFLEDAPNKHSQDGKYFNTYVGYSEEFRITSSSGGIATYLLQELLKRNTVQNIFTVKESSKNGYFYEYTVVGKDDLLLSSKTKYYPVTLATVLDKLIRLFKTSKPEFFALYGNARNVVNTAVRKRKDKGNAATEEGVDE
jgi:coenzyme F420-reducing hydrogenase beta subunit